MLLSNPKIEKLLRDDLVPYWKSVKEPAKVTIEFADGKKLKRTIGGNTVIYLCRDDGGAVDAVPGVYTPDDFLAEARPALKLLKGNLADMRGGQLSRFHREAMPKGKVGGGAITISKRAVESPPRLALQGVQLRQDPGRITTLSKAVVESPMRTPFVDRPMMIKPNRGKSVSQPLIDVSKYPASAAELRQTHAGGKGRSELSPEAFGKHMVQIDSTNNRRVVRPRVHRMFGERWRALTPDQWQHFMFERLLGTDLRDPHYGLTDALVPGTGELVR